MANPVIINPTMTLGGQAAAFNASNTGIELIIDSVSFGLAHYDPTGNELELINPVGSRVPLAGGSRPTPYQLRMSCSWRENVGQVPIGEIAFWSGNTLVFVWSKANGEIASYKTDGVTYVLFCDLAFAQVPANSISFAINPNESAALAALSEHEGSQGAHPQYLLRSDAANDGGQLAWLGLAGGSANALVLKLKAPESKLRAYAPGQRFQFLAKSTNSGAVTANIQGLGQVAVVRGGFSALAPLEAGDIKEGFLYELNFDGAVFQLGGSYGKWTNTWTNLEGKPATLNGFGITDAYTVTETDALLKLKATLASPALTGKPTVPTPALNANDQQVANTAYVQAVVAAVIGGAPGALDTLKELAAALGGDPNFANTIINALAGKADKATTLAGYGILDGMPLGEGCWGSRISALYTDMKAITKTGFTYQIPTSGTLNGLGGAAGSVLTAYSPNSGWQIYIRDNVFMFRGQTGGEWSADLTVWHSGNFNPASYPIKATTLAGYGITDAYTVTAADALLKLKASLASPVFTGKPTAPTAVLGSNDLQLANTAFVQAAIAAVISGAPGALDTLKELADALGGDPNFANTIVNGLAGKANKGEVMPLGEGGWGSAVPYAHSDMKAIGKTCFTYQNPGSGTLNALGYAAGSVLHAESAAGWQLYIRDNVVLFRSNLGSVWTDVLSMWHSGNLDPTTIMPPGTSIDFAGSVAPAGFLKENGAAVSRATYARLFAVIGTTYGAGNGSTTFNLPDSRGEVFRGLDEGRGVDPGRGLGSVQLDQVQGMAYQLQWGQGTTGVGYSGNDLRKYSAAYTADQVSGPVSDGVNGTPRIGAETRMRNVARLKCIKY